VRFEGVRAVTREIRALHGGGAGTRLADDIDVFSTELKARRTRVHIVLATLICIYI